MKWRRIKFQDLFRVKHGYAFKGEFFDNSSELVLLTPGNFNESGGFRDQGEKQKRYSGPVPEGYVLAADDILIAMTEQMSGLLGSSIWIPADGIFLHNQRLGKIVELNEKRLDRRYLYHLFNTALVRNQIAASASGTKVRHTAPERIGRVEVELPPVHSQRKVAEILSSYEFLIENNRRRMALLGESARQLYQEWFVRLRFPGYEHTRIVDGVPDGWNRMTLGECLTLKRGHDLPESNRVPGEIPIVSSSGITGYHNEKKADAPGIVTGRYGTLGEVYYVDQDYWPHNTALYVCDFKGNSPRVLYYFLKHALHSVQSNNAAVPGLNRNVLHTLKVIWPPRSLANQFDEFLTPQFKQLDLLKKANQKLRTARDLLLPRLMSGEITV